MSTPTNTMSREDRAIYRALKLLEARIIRESAPLSSPEIAVPLLRMMIGGKEREEFVALWLNSQNELIKAETLFLGTIAECRVYPREVAKQALACNAYGVIFAHNHPSGSSNPSDADRSLHNTLKKVMDLIDVRVLDNFVITAAAAQSIPHPWVSIGVQDRSKPTRKPRRKTASSVPATL